MARRGDMSCQTHVACKSAFYDASKRRSDKGRRPDASTYATRRAERRVAFDTSDGPFSAG